MALVVVTALIVLVHYGRLDPALWDVPTAYSGDAMEIMARLQAAGEGELRPLMRQEISRLGAPFGADWSEYPPSDTLLFTLLGLLAGVFGIGVASNMALVIAHVLSTLSFYFCARWLRHRWEWAFAGALLFSFSFHSMFRGLAHLSLVFTWTVPLALLCCGLIARSRQLGRRGKVWWLCVLTTGALAVSNPYNLFMFLQLLGWALLARWMGNREPAGWRAGVFCAALAVALLTVMLLPQFLYPADEGAEEVLVRNYGGTERYALKPIELFVPPDVHRSGLLAALGSRYLRWSDWRGETFSPYLGLVAGAAFTGLLILAATRLVRRRACVPRPALAAGWVLAFSVIGGVNNLLAFFLGLQVFRATNRYSVFLSSIALMFLVSRCSRWSVRWPRGASLGCALLVLAVGLWDQLPVRPPAQEAETIARYRADQAFGRELESALSRGDMIYQLPAIEFPEAGPVRGFNAYDHFRPYLATDELRFTFGTLKHRAISAWQQDYEELSPDQLVPALEKAGFAGVLVNRTAYETEAAAKLIRELQQASEGGLIEDRTGAQVLVLLQPDASPAPPVAQGLTFGEGWNPPAAGEPGVHWSWGDASLSYYNPFDDPIAARLEFGLSAVAPRHIRLVHDGRVLVDRGVGVEPAGRERAEITLHPGVNRFDFISDSAPIRTSEERNRLRNVAVHDLHFSVMALETR